MRNVTLLPVENRKPYASKLIYLQAKQSNRPMALFSLNVLHVSFLKKNAQCELSGLQGSLYYVHRCSEGCAVQRMLCDRT